MSTLRSVPVMDQEFEYDRVEFEAGKRARVQCAEWATGATRSWRAGWTTANSDLIADAVIAIDRAAPESIPYLEDETDGASWLREQLRIVFSDKKPSTGVRGSTLMIMLRKVLLVFLYVAQIGVLVAFIRYYTQLGPLGVLGFEVLIVTVATLISFVVLRPRIRESSLARVSLWAVGAVWFSMVVLLEFSAVAYGH